MSLDNVWTDIKRAVCQTDRKRPHFRLVKNSSLYHLAADSAEAEARRLKNNNKDHITSKNLYTRGSGHKWQVVSLYTKTIIIRAFFRWTTGACILWHTLKYGFSVMHLRWRCGSSNEDSGTLSLGSTLKHHSCNKLVKSEKSVIKQLVLLTFCWEQVVKQVVT